MLIQKLAPEVGLYLQLFRFFIVLLIGVLATRVVLMPLSKYLMSKRGVDKFSAHSIENLTGLTGLILSFIFALSAAGFGGLVTVVGAITAALTVAIGFGMRDQVSNIVGGFFIYTDRPFVKGDYIKVEEVEGVVKEITLRSTVLNGSSAEKMVLPNSLLTLNPVKNYTKGKNTKSSLEAKIEAGKVEKYNEKVLEIVKEDEDILEKPQPEIMFKDVEDGKFSVDLTYWVRDSQDAKKVKSRILERISSEEEIFRKEEGSE